MPRFREKRNAKKIEGKEGKEEEEAGSWNKVCGVVFWGF